MLRRIASRVLALSALACLSVAGFSCGEDPAFASARATLVQFQTGLRTGDRALLRKSVTTKSREFVAKLPKRECEQLLEVTEQRRDNGRIYLDVLDPNPDAPVAKGSFVVAKEDGIWLVDLIATAGQGAREVVSEGPNRKQFVPTQIDPQQLKEAARAVEASARRERSR